LSRRELVSAETYAHVRRRDREWTGDDCVGPYVGMPGACHYAIEVDHVRASGGLGLRSRSTPDNLVSLCRDHHRLKTEHGKTWRPALLAYLTLAEG
jgi:5-methylcytosine-specific restriction endonuclease McrA